MKKHARLCLGLSLSALVVSLFAIASTLSSQNGFGTTGTYTLTLSETNGPISGSYSSSTKINSNARTTSGEPFSVSYSNCMGSAESGYKYAQLKSSSGSLYSTYGVRGLLTVSVTYKNAGSDSPKLYFSSSSSFSSYSSLSSGTVYEATGDYFKVAAGGNAIYISTIVLTYSCSDRTSSSSSSSSKPSSSSSSSFSSKPSSSSSGGASSSASSYYSSIDVSSSGAALKSSLSSLILPHTNLGYGGLWEAYKTSDVDSDGKIIDMYSNYHWDPSSKTCGSYSKEGDCFNREHTIPQSIFSKAAPMVSDLNHVYPTDGKVNGMRSNFPHGNVSSATYTSGNGSMLGTGSSLNYGYTGKVFEVIDEYKGDFARTYFYFVTAYEKNIPSYSFDSFSKNTYPSLSKWALNVYLDWSDNDPVSPKEISRNEAVYSLQHNRNPFIDYPSFAHKIWDGAY